MGEHAPSLHGGVTKPKRKPRKTKQATQPVVHEPIPDEADDGNDEPAASSPPAE